MPPEASEPRALAYRYLNRRERTVSEMRAHLEEQGVDARTTKQTLAELADRGYLDDERFARLFAQEKRELAQWGEERIRRGLEARGIEPELAAAAASERGDGGSEAEQALELLRRRIPHPQRGRRQREQALGLLLRRGYEYEVADDAVRAHLGGIEALDEQVG